MDLQRLNTEKDAAAPNVAAPTVVPRPKRKVLTRVALPSAIVLATLALIAYAARDALNPATSVQTTRAVALSLPATDAESLQVVSGDARSAVVAQAPGWVEPDPYPVYASGLTNGVVEKVHVLEGEAVAAGALLVELIDTDAKLALAQAEARRAQATARLAAARAELDEPIALMRAEAVTRAQVSEARSVLDRLDAEVAKEQARLDELAAAYTRLSSLSKRSVSELSVEEAKFRELSQRAAVEAMRQRRAELEAALDNAKAEHAAARRCLELKILVRRDYDEARALHEAAETSVAEAALRLERMAIRSPIDGVVMTRLVGPGSKLMFEMDSPHSAHAVHLYDPNRLQVRVDVPLADAAKVGLDQRAEIVVDVLPDAVFTGKVTRLISRADIAKNTVQFKVAIADPSPLLKPDMLARVKFFSSGATLSGAAPTRPTDASATSSGSPVAIRASAIVERGSETFVWWISPIDRRIQARPVVLGQPRGDGTRAVLSGLNPGDLVVDRPVAALKPNQRVRSIDASTK